MALSITDFMDYDYLMKVVVIGDTAVGKSALLKTFKNNKFDSSYISTIGVDFEIKTIQLDEYDKKVKLQIWDTAGQERFRNITKSYYYGANAILIVYDVTQPQSFNNITKWLREVQKNTAAGDNFDDKTIIMVGNKSDLSAKRMVSYEEGLHKSSDLGIAFLETSAKTKHNVYSAFESLARKYHECRMLSPLLSTLDNAAGSTRKKYQLSYPNSNIDEDGNGIFNCCIQM